MKILRSSATVVLLCAGIARFGAFPASAQQSKYVSPPGYISGTVQGEKGPEAGVWVIAETKDLPTKMIKIVVTDDRGRFMLPELPAANYKVWVRGYGIVDSSPIDEKPGATNVALKVTSAKTPQEAAKVYPGDYWLSLLAPPAKSLFPGRDPTRQRCWNGHADPEPLDQLAEVGLQFLPPAGKSIDPRRGDVFAAKPELTTDT